MFRLSQKADYGLILLSSLSRAKSRASIAQIAKKHKIPPKFLAQIAQELKKAGILTSKEGMLGGYALAKPKEEIKLLDVLTILDGEIMAGKCFEEDHECICGAGGMFADMKKQIEESIGKKTAADLC